MHSLLTKTQATRKTWISNSLRQMPGSWVSYLCWFSIIFYLWGIPLVSHVLQKDSYCLSSNYFLQGRDVSRNVCLIAGAPVSRSSTSCPGDGVLPLFLSPLLSQVMHGFSITQSKFFKHCAKVSPYLSTQTPCSAVDFGFTSHSFLLHTDLSYGTIKENTSHRGKKYI